MSHRSMTRSFAALFTGWVAWSVLPVAAYQSQRCDCTLVWHTPVPPAPEPTTPLNALDLVNDKATEAVVYSTMPLSRNVHGGLVSDLSNATLACSCEPVHAKSVTVILAAVKLRPDGPTALACMANGVLERICGDLAKLGLLTCDARWATGFLALASPSLVQSDSLRDIVRRIFRSDASASPCHESIDFVTTVDSSIGM